MDEKIEQVLKELIGKRKEQICFWAGIDARTYRHWDPDIEFAEWEVVEELTNDLQWDQKDYDEVVGSKLFRETAFVHACANMVGI